MSSASLPPAAAGQYRMGRAGSAAQAPEPRPATGLDYAALGHASVTWSLAMDLADQIPPAGFARPALVLAALLDPAGIPGVVFTTPAACGYLTGHPAMPAEPAQARDAVHGLARAGLVTINAASTTRTVQVHPAIQAMTRGIIPAPELEEAVRCAADALLQSWPADPVPHRLAQALRDCPISLRECSGDLLWTPQTHPILLLARPEPGQRRDEQPGPRLLAGDAGDQRPGARRRTICRPSAAMTAWPPPTRLRGGWTTQSASTSTRSSERQRALGTDHPDVVDVLRPPRPGLRRRGAAHRGAAYA